MTWIDVAKILVVVWFAVLPTISFTATSIAKVIATPRPPLSKIKTVTVVTHEASNTIKPSARSEAN